MDAVGIGVRSHQLILEVPFHCEGITARTQDRRDQRLVAFSVMLESLTSDRQHFMSGTVGTRLDAGVFGVGVPITDQRQVPGLVEVVVGSLPIHQAPFMDSAIHGWHQLALGAISNADELCDVLFRCCLQHVVGWKQTGQI